MEIFYKGGKAIFCLIIVGMLTCFSQEGCCFLRGVRRKTRSLLREVKKLPGGGTLDLIETAIKPSSSRRKKGNKVLVTTPDYFDDLDDPDDLKSRLDDMDILDRIDIGLNKIKSNETVKLVGMIMEAQNEIERIYDDIQVEIGKNQNNIDIMKKIINIQDEMIRKQIDNIILDAENTQNNTLSYIKETQSRMIGYYSFLTVIGVGVVIILNNVLHNVLHNAPPISCVEH